jgi:hypothetical protein
MALIDKLYNSCVAMSQKASKGMRQILQKNLIPQPNPNGIINKTDITVTKSGAIITLETHFPDYAYFVEYGRAKGKRPPIEPIRKWCYLHNLPEGVEWHVQKRIGERGTKGKHFLEPLKRMLEMVSKTLQQVSKVEFMATYNNLVYENTQTLREMKLTI